MAQPYIGEIRLFAGNFAPAGWMFCAGQTLPISEYDVLFNLIGTTYGGDGQETFMLPDLRGRVPVHQGTGPGLSTKVLAETGGVESVTLTTNQIPQHNHQLIASSEVGNQAGPASNLLAGSASVALYNENAPEPELANSAVANAGGSQPHENLQPYLCINYIIALFGIYPTPN